MFKAEIRGGKAAALLLCPLVVEVKAQRHLQFGKTAETGELERVKTREGIVVEELVVALYLLCL